MSDVTARRLGEFGLIRRIQQQVEQAPHLVCGIGDDCAVQMQDSSLELLTSTDLLIEGIHFNRRWTTMRQLGGKAAAVNLSDIAAMGGTPQSLFLAIGSPQQVSDAELEELAQGFLQVAKENGATLAGGDTCGSPGPLFIAVTVQGVVARGQAICRHGARAGDSIYASGHLGDSALALQMLLRGEKPPAELAERHHNPHPRIRLGQQLGREALVSAMLDVSDGLIGDLSHILEASQVSAELELERLPLSTRFREQLVGTPQLIELALSGGEDYELLFTAADQHLEQRQDLSPAVTKIGRISQGSGIRVLQADGSNYPYGRGGFDHFS